MAAKKKAKKTKKTVSLTVDVETLQKVLDAIDILGAPGFCLEKFVDDPVVASRLKKRRAKRK
jgi:hypothetical protein